MIEKEKSGMERQSTERDKTVRDGERAELKAIESLGRKKAREREKQLEERNKLAESLPISYIQHNRKLQLIGRFIDTHIALLLTSHVNLTTLPV